MNFLTQKQEVASQARLDLNNSNISALVGRWLNMSGKEIWGEEAWNFTLDRGIVQTVVDKTAGTVSVNAASTTVTGSSTSFDTTIDVGKFIQFSSSNNWYKITAVASATSLTIESAYVGTTNLSAGTYTIRQWFYTMPTTCEAVLSVRQTISPASMTPVTFREFDINRPGPVSTGDPVLYFVYGIDSAGSLRFTPYPWPSAIENIEVRYKKLYTDLSSDTDTTTIPARWHETVMIEGAMWRALRYSTVGQPTARVEYQDAYRRYVAGIDKMKAFYNPDPGLHSVIQSRDVAISLVGPNLPYKFGV